MANASKRPAAPDPYQGIPNFHQLPYDVQKEIPPIDISVHMYAPTPRGRWARINDVVYGEGDLIDSNLKLEQITPDGLILSRRNERFWLTAR